MPATSDKTLICKFWLKQRCDRGDCKYAHGEDEKRAACRALTCQFFASGYCRLGTECLYRHALEEESFQDPACSSDEKEPGSGCEVKSAASTTASEADTPSLGPASSSLDSSSYKRDWQLGKYDKTQPCKFWQEGRCQRGQQCKYAHGDDELRRACGAILCKHLQRGGRCRLGEACWFAHTEPCETGNLPDGEPACARISLPPPALPASPQDKTLLCKFWMKNRCERSSCRYAHGEEEKRRACKAIMCSFEASGGCRLGSECLYAHTWESPLRADIAKSGCTGKEIDRLSSDETESPSQAVSGQEELATVAEPETSACGKEAKGSTQKDILKSVDALSSPSRRDPTAGSSWITSRQSWADLSDSEDSP
mmetsp:Transcript_26365/g.61158  ORF Transcript_26365/g.61158 Transcript_26365/m.61158 type:complete len:368 (+) Transcript_26365:79-1182(+)